MKKLILGLILGSAIHTTNSQIPTKNDLQEMHLNGKVKSVRETCYLAIQKGNTIELGKRATENKDEKDTYVVLNEEGKKTEKYENNSDGSLYSRIMYQYNDKANVIQEEGYKADGSLEFTRRLNYKYDDKGIMIEKHWLKADGNLEYKATWNYDDKGKAIQRDMFDANDKLIGRQTFDKMGNVMEDIGYKADGSIDWKTAYIYDENGNNIEQNEYEGTKFIIKYLHKHDDKGNQTEIDWCKENGKPYKVYYLKYEYDKNGNWIRQTQFLKDKPTYIYQRELAYY